MKNYRITVNGNTYDVQVEELNGAVATKAPTVTQATPVAAPNTSCCSYSYTSSCSYRF